MPTITLENITLMATFTGITGHQHVYRY